MGIKYRPEIDGLRTLAVFSVIIFHAGYLPNGFLGVDIFFVISGYLITGIIWQDITNQKFSISNFYERRIRRIIPLMLVISFFAFILGLFYLLPDDFENLCQSIIATIFFSNNLLLFLTSGYWNIVNEYKALMHTWSLGVEEQFYFIYPLLLVLFSKISRKKLFAGLILILVVSFLSNLIYPDKNFHFFSVTSRFWQLALGGLASIFTSTQIYHKMTSSINRVKVVGNISFLFILFIIFSILPNTFSGIWLNLTATLFVVVLILFASPSYLLNFLYRKEIVYLGKLSFSIYLWHQLVFVFFRINSIHELTVYKYVLAIIVTILLSAITYYFVETPFRNKAFISKTKLYIILIVFSSFLLGSSYWVYKKAGVIRDYPELGLKSSENHTAGENAEYNDRVYKMDVDFNEKDSIHSKVLVIGSSFGRDFVNMLLENKLDQDFQISYIYLQNFDSIKYAERLKQSDVIIYSSLSSPTQKGYEDIKKQYFNLKEKYAINGRKFFFTGTKSFGNNVNAFFNTSEAVERCNIRTDIDHVYIEINQQCAKDLGNDFIDILGTIDDKASTVPVFTDNCKLISQDCEHLTKFGAEFVGKKLNEKYQFKQLFSN
jgi:peptidoglycan/LPS O-acetylase OafA/YrhL